MRPEIRPLPLLIALAFSGCVMKDEQGCTLELRINFCVTANGKSELPPQYEYIRERIYQGTTIKDTLSKIGFNPSGNCFGEATGRMRVLAVSKDTVINQSAWITVATVDGCHAAPAIVDLAF